MKRIVISGGSGSGKSTTLNELSRLGYKIIPESAIEIIQERNQKLGVEEQIKWRTNHVVEFQILVAKRQAEKVLNLEKVSKPHEPVFLDRDVLDCLAFCELRGVKPNQELLNIVTENKSDKLFLLDTLSNFQPKLGTGRTCDYETSLKVNKLLKKVYQAQGVPVLEVKEAPLSERIKFILENLK